jgi:hypothetical protein
MTTTLDNRVSPQEVVFVEQFVTRYWESCLVSLTAIVPNADDFTGILERTLASN